MFQKKVLNLVKKIPKGKVTTYKIIAEKLQTKACRAVGNALNKNKQLIVIPCHRVVNCNGKIGGYSGGINKKIRLLKKEGVKIKNNKVVDFDKLIFSF